MIIQPQTRRARSRYWSLIFFGGLLIFLLTGGCSPAQKTADVPQADSRPLLRMGAIPSESADKVQDQYKDLITYIERSTGYRIELIVAEDYQGIIAKMGKKELDVAYFGPFSYIIAHDTAGARAFASPEFKRSGTDYFSNIITHAATGIQNIGQLKGKTFSFTDIESTSGYLVPKALMKKHGIDPDRDFSKILFLGKHDTAVLAVKNRSVDAASVSSNVLKGLLEKGIVDENEIRVLLTSDPIPQSVWAHREDLPPETARKIKQAFLMAHQEAGALGIYGKEVNRFISRDDSAYDIIRETANLLNHKGK